MFFVDFKILFGLDFECSVSEYNYLIDKEKAGYGR